MIIRKIQLKDAEKFLIMLRALDNDTAYMLYGPGERDTTIEEMKKRNKNIQASNSLLLIAEENDQIVGYLSAQRGFANRIKHSAYIVTGILKDYRGRGIGTTFFEGLEIWALESGIIRLELTMMLHNDHALGLYQKMGFKIEGLKEKSMIISDHYVDEYYMAKIIAQPVTLEEKTCE